MPAGVNNTDESHVGTRTSLGLRVCPFDSKRRRYFSRSSSVFMAVSRIGYERFRNADRVWSSLPLPSGEVAVSAAGEGALAYLVCFSTRLSAPCSGPERPTSPEG